MDRVLGVLSREAVLMPHLDLMYTPLAVGHDNNGSRRLAATVLPEPDGSREGTGNIVGR